MSHNIWTGTWEDALEQADPALLAECMGLIETLGLLESWSDLASWGSADEDVLDESPLREVDPEACKVMLACAFMVEMDRMSSEPVQEIRQYFTEELTPANVGIRLRFRAALNVISSMRNHLSFNWNPPSVCTLTYRSRSINGSMNVRSWDMTFVIPGYSPENWKLYDLNKDAVVAVMSDGTVVLVSGQVFNRYPIFVSYDRGRLKSKQVAEEYARRYGYMVYDMILSTHPDHVRLLPKNIRRPLPNPTSGMKKTP